MSTLTQANYALARRYWLKRALEARRYLRAKIKAGSVAPLFALRDVQTVLVALRRARKNGSWWSP